MLCERLDAPAQVRLAEAAYATLKGGEAIFLDASSTASSLARRIVAGTLSLKILTNSAPVMQLVATAEAPNLELHAIGGRMCRTTASYVGPMSVQSIGEHFADMAFIGDAGVAQDGVLTTDEGLEAAVKAAMLEQADETVLLLSAPALGLRARRVIGPVSSVALVLAHGLTGREARQLQALGTTVRRVDKERVRCL